MGNYIIFFSFKIFEIQINSFNIKVLQEANKLKRRRNTSTFTNLQHSNQNPERSQEIEKFQESQISSQVEFDWLGCEANNIKISSRSTSRAVETSSTRTSFILKNFEKYSENRGITCYGWWRVFLFWIWENSFIFSPVEPSRKWHWTCFWPWIWWIACIS